MGTIVVFKQELGNEYIPVNNTHVKQFTEKKLGHHQSHSLPSQIQNVTHLNRINYQVAVLPTRSLEGKQSGNHITIFAHQAWKT